MTVDRDIQVLICDDYAPMRALLRWIIEERAGLAVVGEAGDGNDAIEQAAASAAPVTSQVAGRRSIA